MKPFAFKEFTVHHDRCAMKVGTDGVLIGAWAKLDNPLRVLDIGAGTGLVSLMMAQRHPKVVIDAVEIDEDAFNQCKENFDRSKWKGRLQVFHAPFQEFYKASQSQYDLIISNPPFFTGGVESLDEKRNLARISNSLSFNVLANGAGKLLVKEGRLALIIPVECEDEIIGKMKNDGLIVNRITRVRGREGVPLKRCLIEFEKSEEDLPIYANELIIEKSRHDYTSDYIKLTKSFYLNM
ncbi:MAG: methyltransferase [Flavobacteriales bacterium]|nr:methyltransferase [Flavobacteriales bacterium]